jgi:hypothetical protein
MSRWFAWAADATSGGSTYDTVATAEEITAPTAGVPVTDAQVDPGETALDRNNVVLGHAASLAPFVFARSPTMTVSTLAYPQACRAFVPKAFGGAITTTGDEGEAQVSTIAPLASGNLPAIVGWLLREEQLDRMTGMVISELGLNFPIDAEGTMSLTFRGLYHRVDDASAITDPGGDSVTLPTPTYAYGDGRVYTLRDAIAYEGDGAGVELDRFAGFGFTLPNSFADDMRATHRPRHNVESTVLDSVEYPVWFPARHKRSNRAPVTGRIDFADTEPDQELMRILRAANKLVFEVEAGDLDTTPAAKETMRLTMLKRVNTGGGADPLQREGEQYSSYEFGAYLDLATGKDVEAEFTGEAALTL